MTRWTELELPTVAKYMYMGDGLKKLSPSDTRQSAEPKRARLSQKRYSGRCCPNCIPVVDGTCAQAWDWKNLQRGPEYHDRRDPEWERGRGMPGIVSGQVWA